MIMLGVAICLFGLFPSEKTPGLTTLSSFAWGLLLVAIAFSPEFFRARRVTCDESGCFHFRSLFRDVAAAPGTIVSIRRFTFNWPYRRPVLVTTTLNRIYLTQQIERRAELRAALLRANPQMKIGTGTLTD
jgi:hypothetical protein